jgi:hypothetical protein
MDSNMYEFEDDPGEDCEVRDTAGLKQLALERQADRLLGREFSMWRGAKIEDTGPAQGEPDNGKRHRPIAIVSYDPYEKYKPTDAWGRPKPPSKHSGSTVNFQLEMLDFVVGTFKLDDVDMWLWAVMTMPDDPDDDETTKFYIERELLMTEPVEHGPHAEAQIRARNSLIMSHIASGVPAIGDDDGFVPPPRHDPDPVCSTGFFTVSLRQRRKEYAREQGEKLKVFRPRRRFTRTKPKLAQPHRVKAALMKLLA